MKLRFLVLPLLVFPLLTARAWSQTAPAELDLSKWQTGGVTLGQGNGGLTRLTFETYDWPNTRFVAPAPLDWKGKSLSIETFNPGTAPLEFYVRVDDDLKADGWRGSRTAKMTALPGQKQHWLVSFGSDPMTQGMRAFPPATAPVGTEVVVANGAAPLNLGHIASWQIFLSHPQEKYSLDVGDLQLVPSSDADLHGIINEFGQYSRAEWPGKIRSLADLKAAQDVEQHDLLAHIKLSGRDAFGGDANGPQLAATGFFRTQKVGDKWWLVTPQGHTFWSAGVDVVQSSEPTITAGREFMFTSLPTDGDPLARFRGVENNVLMGPQKGNKPATFDFYQANLYRKYGDKWKADWELITLGRLRSWGFNTIGNWSDPSLHNPTYGAVRIPYTAPVYLWGDHAKVSDGQNYWGEMHDPFDPKFASDVAARIAEAVTGVKDDPYCLGYFVDNELAWGSSDDANWRTRYGLALGSLAANSNSPAKAAFLADLKAKYATIEALNAAWKTNFASWDALSITPCTLGEAPNDAQKADLSAFLAHFADQYFRVVSETLKKADPNHLYLGCRFAWRTPEAMQSAAKWCDVVSFNVYAKSLDDKEWAFVQTLGKPALIGEFHMGALDRGMFHPGLVAAKDQTERAHLFADYLQSVAQSPAFVGAHWFQYSDEATTGRPLDGENYNIGFVSATDTPYPELVAAARIANANIYRWHSGN